MLASILKLLQYIQPDELLRLFAAIEELIGAIKAILTNEAVQKQMRKD